MDGGVEVAIENRERYSVKHEVDGGRRRWTEVEDDVTKETDLNVGRERCWGGGKVGGRHSIISRNFGTDR